MLQAVFQELKHDADDHTHPPIPNHQRLRERKKTKKGWVGGWELCGVGGGRQTPTEGKADCASLQMLQKRRSHLMPAPYPPWYTIPRSELEQSHPSCPVKTTQTDDLNFCTRCFYFSFPIQSKHTVRQCNNVCGCYINKPNSMLVNVVLLNAVKLLDISDTNRIFSVKFTFITDTPDVLEKIQ